MGSRVVKRAFKYRFYPSAQQEQELRRTFGCVRKVWNMALDVRTAAWVTEQRHVNYVETSALLTAWKRDPELAFLGEVSSVPLQQGLRHLQTAFTNFFGKRARYPRFKSRKRGKASAEYTRSAFRYRDGALTLAKMSEPLDIVWSRPLPDGAEPTTVTVSLDPAGRWHVSLLCETTVADGPPTDTVVGVDAGITSLVTLSTGEKIVNPRYERADRARLAKAQRRAAHKQKGSNNRARANRKVAKVYARIADRRRDHLHKLSSRLVRDSQTIVIEDLNVRNMLGNHSLARAISDAAWRELRGMLAYKSEWYGRELVVIDRWFPSSKVCHVCGALQDSMPLDVREWTCACGAVHDRDINAAKVLEAVGGRRPQPVEIDGRPTGAAAPGRSRL